MLPRLSTVAVVVFWLATMSWLVVTKVVPPLLIGDPPSYQRQVEHVLDTGTDQHGWDLFWNHAQVGWAGTRQTQLEDGNISFRTYVRLDEVPIEDIFPTILGNLLGNDGVLSKHLHLEADTRIQVDPHGNLIDFDSGMKLAGIPLYMRGVVQGNQLKVSIPSLGTGHSSSTYLPADSMVGGVLSPQSQLHDLYVGQKWTQPVHSPFTPRGRAIEILQAEVEDEEVIRWNDRDVRTFRVVYRSDQGSGLNSAVKGRMWVQADGTVLKQEMAVLSSKLTFVRSTEPIDELPRLEIFDTHTPRE